MLVTTNKFSKSLEEAFTFLDSSEYLTEQECVFYPAMVPVVENSRLSLNMIRLEDLVDYSLANNITDAGYAVKNICESSSIDISTVGFTVNETSIIDDHEMEDTLAQFMESGVPVFVNPISDNDVAYILAEAIVNEMCSKDDCDYLLEAYITDNFSALNEEIIGTAITPVKSLGKELKYAPQKIIDTISTPKSRTQNREWVIKKIASLRKILRKIKDGATGFIQPKYKALANKINGAIDYLKNKIKRK